MTTFLSRITVIYDVLAVRGVTLSSFCGVASNPRLVPGQCVHVCVIGARHNVQDFVPGLSVGLCEASNLESLDMLLDMLARRYQNNLPLSTFVK